MKLKFSLLFVFCAFIQNANSNEVFVVEELKIVGSQRIPSGTIYNKLPVTVGDKFSLENAVVAIRELFKTGFFKDIWLEKDHKTLLINVKERPSIAKIIFEGNNDISDEALTNALSKKGLAEGKLFKQSILDKVQAELRRLYFSQGKYGLKIDAKVSPLTRNRVGINVNISEGKAAKVKQINIVGNTAFSTEKLREEFALNSGDWKSFYTKNNQYSKQKLLADLERLRSYYLDRGFMNFAIDSTQVTITPDKKEIYITINISEGEVFVLGQVKVVGKLIIEADEIIRLVQVGPGEKFSQKRVAATSKAIADRLGDEGYIFANAGMVPDVDNKNKIVNMIFYVDAGKRIYVRAINFKGNTKTRDEVLRREMRQMEASWASISKIERSKTRLERLGYFEPGSVTSEMPPVVGKADEIDVNYTVKEKPLGQLSAGFGFSQNSGLVLNANVSQDNFFGSGKRVNLAFSNSDVTTLYRFGLYDPYFTMNGVGLGYDLSYRKTDASEANSADYSTNKMHAGVNLGIPLNESDRFSINLDLERTKLNYSKFSKDKCEGDKSKRDKSQIHEFMCDNGDTYNIFSITVGWVSDSLNRAVFPTEGSQQRLSASIASPGSDLQFYKINYRHQYYLPLAQDLTFRFLGNIAYGGGYGNTKELPFFENYYAGGVGSVRGYDDNTLGPTNGKSEDHIGGSFKIVASAELFFPIPFVELPPSVRVGAFFDSGMVDEKGFEVNELRYSAGLSGSWLSPFGALSVSLAVPFKSDGHDKEKYFQFSFGSSF